MNSQSTEPEKAEFHTPAIPNMVRDYVKENFQENVSPDPVQLTLSRLDTLELLLIQNQKTGRKSQNHCVQMELHLWRYLRNMREAHLTLQDLESQQEKTLGSQPAHLVTFTCKATIASGSVEYQFESVEFCELYISYLSYIDKLAIFYNNCNRHCLLLTFYVFQDHHTSKYIHSFSIVIDVFNRTTVKVQIL